MGKNLKIHANGKLLLSGEYLVLLGAEALAFPLRFGQQLSVKQIDDAIIHWKSYKPDGLWFETIYQLPDFQQKTTDSPIDLFLKKILISACELNPQFLNVNRGYEIEIKADYPLEWGLGSSSTLISLIAQWAEVDEFSLFRKVSNGSGYDLACARRKEPFIYSLSDNKPKITPISIGKALTNYSYFVYLGKKQNSQEEINSFLQNHSFTDKNINDINSLTYKIAQENDPIELCRHISEHEKIMAALLKKQSIFSTFKWFPGAVKSLGAGGGDFAIFVSEIEQKKVFSLIQEKGFNNIFTFNDLKIK